ncbi:homoserine kinase [Luteitalea sp. TBR-22]|uniref:homoserine kinase n=1 Tax=Luteitalea sp. TBR-22 TaxID=2802971 RepID=UPI001AF9187F|nr:homoserine kinase [Luteitalea sp. TBR-22]BCS33720.1 homoserine kinase [Luteitalea sp. TBR-22]
MTAARPLSTVVVPASTSNLGPGFDALGLALELYLRADVTAITDDGRGQVRCTFTGAVPPGDNFIATGFEAVRAALGLATVPSVDVTVTCDIPPCAGLGSSAAALVAGGRLAALVMPGVTDSLLIDVITAIEGHPDNVTAAILGGLVAGCVRPDGHVVAVASRWPEAVRLVVATPSSALLTKTARAVLPAQVSRGDAIFNVQRVALLMQAVATGRTDVLRDAFEDRLHQPYRAALVPGLEAVLALEVPGKLGAFLSGAGPSVAVCVGGDPAPVVEALRGAYATIDPAVTIRVLDIHQPAHATPLAVSHG